MDDRRAYVGHCVGGVCVFVIARPKSSSRAELRMCSVGYQSQLGGTEDAARVCYCSQKERPRQGASRQYSGLFQFSPFIAIVGGGRSSIPDGIATRRISCGRDADGDHGRAVLALFELRLGSALGRVVATALNGVFVLFVRLAERVPPCPVATKRVLRGRGRQDLRRTHARVTDGPRGRPG
jgi:hypothetical protein